MEENSSPPMLTIDPGVSDTKSIWRVTPFKPELLMMSPEVVEVSPEAINFYKHRRITRPSPENESWVEYEGTLYAVGFLAHNVFNARVFPREPKSEWAIAKVLAAVGVMAAKEALPDTFDLALAMPLPYTEWEDRKRFERDLTKALLNFSFCDKALIVNLKIFICVPEGGGHVMIRGEKLGSKFNQLKIASLMWGYRDISIVQFDNGVMSGHTEPLGFLNLIKMVQNRISGYNSRERERLLLETVHSVGKDIKSKNFKHLALSRNPTRKLEETELLAEAIRACRSEYWRQVRTLLTRYISEQCDEIIIGGGCLDYYREELKTFYSQNFSHSNISWGAELEEDVRVSFNLGQKSKSLCARLTDVYGLSNFLRLQVCTISTVGSLTR
ncbi:ParM/StbA family protein [Nostoc sp. CHAB 5836]|uniref:ParM/StbA family protein n=1 Tax=Nostoc sp. CHAB 5836 TaxID=2780404 RepID=UPI001E65BB41|nr:ParM/StbA family protein [Nostoc sp. CHAB 5836]MCC5618792.1 ParM/StbA family protein [Nostoc sp. CHAB 5836]